MSEKCQKRNPSAFRVITSGILNIADVFRDKSASAGLRRKKNEMLKEMDEENSQKLKDSNLEKRHRNYLKEKKKKESRYKTKKRTFFRGISFLNEYDKYYHKNEW